MVEPLKPANWRRAILPTVAVIWLLALVTGVRYMFAYETTPGAQGAAPQAWPGNASLDVDPALPALVIALHPRCSCSQATLHELQQAARDFKHPYSAVMLIYTPSGADYRWQDVSFYREAQQALHAKVVLDQDGRIAQSFGALTSGEVLYYSPAGTARARTLLFSGGVTGSRGMVGDNPGIQALKTAFNTSQQPTYQAGLARTPVFGCGLHTAGTSASGKSTR